MERNDSRLPPRFWSKVIEYESGYSTLCWLWIGARTGLTERGYGGYAQILRGSRRDGSRRIVYGHRWAYEVAVGPIPDGLELDHLCRVHNCVRPSHLELVTHQENMRRGVHRNGNEGKTACKSGHPFDSMNTWVSGRTGQRQCRTCNRERAARRRAARPTSRR